MALGADEITFAEVLNRLNGEGDDISWSERRKIAKLIKTSIEAHGQTPILLSILEHFAKDEKWEVRLETAYILSVLPENEFNHYAALLSNDSNEWVLKAVEKAMDQRRRGQHNAERQQKDFDHVLEFQRNFESVYGPKAAIKARGMAEKLYDILAGATAHEMGNIITPLKSSADTLLANLDDENIDPKLFKQTLQKMSKRIDVLERLRNDMRSYSKETPIVRRRERLLSVIDESLQEVLDIFKSNDKDVSGIDVEVDVPENINVYISKYQIGLAFKNIIKNAFEAFSEKPNIFGEGKIAVSAYEDDGQIVEIIITDTGMGLSPEELAEQLRFIPGGSSKVDGTGLGLPIAQKKIKDQGGNLFIVSELGEGTKVTINLPTSAVDRSEQ